MCTITQRGNRDADIRDEIREEFTAVLDIALHSLYSDFRYAQQHILLPGYKGYLRTDEKSS
jgi:hypothetical protein